MRPLRFLPVLLLLAAVGVSLPAPAAGAATSSAPAGTTTVRTLSVGGTERSYRLFVPSQLPAGPRPLLVALHSFTRSAAWFESATNLDAGAVKTGSLVAYPDGLDSSWNAGKCCSTSSANGVDDVAFLAAVIADVAAAQPVDRNRVAMTGYSTGGMMAFRFACERSDLVDAVVVDAGAFVGPTCSFQRPVSLLQVHGLRDDVVPYAGGTLASLGTTFPNIKGPLSAVASLDGCKGSTSAPFNGSPVASLWQARACPAGTYVWLVTSTTMGHQWPTGAGSVATYGIDVTGTAWGFLQGVWAARGPAVAA